MAESNMNGKARQMTIRHRGRGAQIWIYLGKMLRMFVYQNDWKVLPMAALIAALVGMVIRKRLFITMEGTLMGAFALVMVCIWNGCFNSIQVICRERDVIKREHRSGMHISSYIVSHMLYQALLCLAQTGVTLYITKLVGVRYGSAGVITPWMIVDYGISMFLITYASDMMSLWVSSLAKTTTTAMTIMPFVLIFQLVFSGGMMALPAWTDAITPYTISNPALKVLAAQGDYNNRPVMTIWNQVQKMKDSKVSATITLGQALDLLGKKDDPTIAKVRQTQISRVFTLGELREMLDIPGLDASIEQNADAPVSDGITLGDLADKLGMTGIDMLIAQNADKQLGRDITLGELVDRLANDPSIQAHLGDSYTFENTVGGLIDLAGEDKVADVLQNKVAEASQNPAYDNVAENIVVYWLKLLLFVFAFAALSTITLEFIDKDKR
ncbi:MAG: ABC transporter permease [Clostridia bacterium]|nr:ABC transporter permease [Clostridia bacterium]